MIPFSIWSHGWQALEKNKWKIISISFKYQSHVTWDTRTPLRGKLSKTSVDRLISELYNCSARSFLQIGLEEIDFVFFRKPNTARWSVSTRFWRKLVDLGSTSTDRLVNHYEKNDQSSGNSLSEALGWGCGPTGPTGPPPHPLFLRFFESPLFSVNNLKGLWNKILTL